MRAPLGDPEVLGVEHPPAVAVADLAQVILDPRPQRRVRGVPHESRYVLDQQGTGERRLGQPHDRLEQEVHVLRVLAGAVDAGRQAWEARREQVDVGVRREEVGPVARQEVGEIGLQDRPVRSVRQQGGTRVRLAVDQGEGVNPPASRPNERPPAPAHSSSDLSTSNPPRPFVSLRLSP